MIDVFMYDTNGIKLDFMTEINEVYFMNPYIRSSVDLIQAVAEQYKFSYHATQNIKWDASHDYSLSLGQYNEFMQLIKKAKNPTMVAIPSIRAGIYLSSEVYNYIFRYYIDVVWHAHMLDHCNYVTHTKLGIGSTLDHNNIPYGTEKLHIDMTNVEWKLLQAKDLQNRAVEKIKMGQLTKKKIWVCRMLKTAFQPVVDYKQYNVEEASYHGKGMRLMF